MGNKKKTMDELLEEALVPHEEQPYEVPDNWIWTKLDALKSHYPYSLVDGPFGSNLKTTDYTETGVRLIQLQNIGDGYWKNENKKYISKQKAAELERCNTFPGEIAIAKMASPIARATIVPYEENRYVVVADCIKFKPNSKLDKRFLLYCINSPLIRNIAEKWGKGSTRKRINLKDVKNLPIPLPPINEQNLIADKVERLLSKIDEAQQLIEEAKESFELRRAAILDKAFRGELTREWRKAHSSIVGSHNQLDIPSNWKVVKFCDVVEMQNGMSKRRGTTGSPVPVLRLADIKGSEFDDSNLRNILLTEKELIKYKLNKDDILFIRVNGSKALVGKAIHFTLENDIAYCDHLIRGTFDKNVVTAAYIKYLFESQMIRNQIKGKIVSSAGQNTISQGSLGSIEIPLPPIEEIHEIESILKRINIKEKELATYYNKIDNEKLKQSILSKAFRGELGTNDLSEENAVELLKEVLAEQVK